MNTYIYTQIYTHIHTYIHTYTYKHIHTHTYIRIYIHLYIHKYIPTHINTYIHTDRQRDTHTYPHIHTHTYTHMCVHTKLHTFKQTHTHPRPAVLYSPFLIKTPQCYALWQSPLCHCHPIDRHTLITFSHIVTSNRPDRAWGPPSPLYSGHQVSWAGVKCPELGAEHLHPI